MLDTTRKHFWCERVTITPAEAKAITEANNTNNRDLSRPLIRKMAADMVKGKWKMNGESLKFANNGRLVDGQHRLHAVIESGADLDTVACGGFDPAIFDTLDVGKKRGLQDLMKISGVPNYIAASGATKWLMRLDQKNPIGNRSHDLKPADELEYYTQHEVGIQNAIRFYRTLKSVKAGEATAPRIACPQALAVALCKRFTEIDEDFCHKFFRTWNDASERPDLVTTSPAAILADALAERMATLARIGGRFHDADRLLMIVTTWNKWIRGEKIRSTDIHKISVQDKRTNPKWPGILGPRLDTETSDIFADAEPADAE